MQKVINFFILTLLMQQVCASPLSDSAVRLIKTGNEIASPSVVMSGQKLLLKAMFQGGDLDAAYAASKQVRAGNHVMGYAPQPQAANKILANLLKKGYDPATFDVALYLLDGSSGFPQDSLTALNLFEESLKTYANAESAFIAAVIRNEELVLLVKDNRLIDELITFAILNKVKGAKRYQFQRINKNSAPLQVKNWRKWLKNR